MNKLSSNQLKSLETNGYLIFKGLLDSEKIAELKQKLIKIRQHEGPRLGEHGFSKIREDLIEKKSKFRL